MAIAGRVAIVPKGDWSANATYKRLDAVTYNNTLYFAKKEVPAGTATSNTEYWSKSIVGSVVTVDDTLSSTSTNPVQNKVVKAYVDKKAIENVDFSTSTSKTLNGTLEAPLIIGKATRNLLNPSLLHVAENDLKDSGITAKINSNGSITLNGTSTRSIWSALYTTHGSGNNNMFKGLRVFTNLKYNGSNKYGELYMAYCRNNDGTQETWRSNNNGDLIPDGNGEPCWVRLHITSGATFNNETFFIMLTDDDAGAVNDELIPYSGYNIKTIGKNLLNPTLQTTTTNGVTCTNNGDGTYTLNGTAADTATFVVQAATDMSKEYIHKDLLLAGCPEGGSIGTYRLQYWNNAAAPAIDFGNSSKFQIKHISRVSNIAIIIDKGFKANKLLFKPMLTTDLNATYDDFVPYQDGGTVHIDSSTEFPLLGLKSFDGTTNIISPGNVEVTYAKSDSGKAILDMSENKLDKDNVVNNQTTTEAGFALDARQANPNINGTLAKQVADLNGSLNSKKIPSISIENIFTGNPFCVISGTSDLASFSTKWEQDNGGYHVDDIKYPAGAAVNLTVSLTLPAHSIVIIDVSTLNQENIKVQGTCIKYNLTDNASNSNLSISFTGRNSNVTSSTIRYMPLVIHLG